MDGRIEFMDNNMISMINIKHLPVIVMASCLHNAFLLFKCIFRNFSADLFHRNVRLRNPDIFPGKNTDHCDDDSFYSFH